MNNKGFSGVAAFILILIVAIAVGAGVYFWQQQDIDNLEKQVELFQDKEQGEQTEQVEPALSKAEWEKTNEQATTILDEETETLDEVDDTNVDDDKDDVVGDENAGNFNTELVYLDNTISSSEVTRLLSDSARSTITQETITGTMAVKATNDKLYFTTIENNVEGLPKSKIYSFDSSRDKLVELYWEKYGKEFWLMGQKDTSLVVFKTEPDFRLTDCKEPWDYTDQIQYLDLDNITNGLEDYSIPKDVMTKHLDYVEACEKR